VPGAQAAAAAVARHCVVDMGWTPVTCGYQAHEAASALVELGGYQMFFLLSLFLIN
jgi:uncharacterized cysteine cluster protein YcgN (CxxCxxCC family)